MKFCRQSATLIDLYKPMSEMQSILTEAICEVDALVDAIQISLWKDEQPKVDFVTLQQCAPMVNRSKRTLERWKMRDPTFPTPDVIGTNGSSDEWKWSTIRPYLEKKASRVLPEVFPAHVR